MMDKLAIIIFSCEKYSDLWENYFVLFNNYFRKENEKVYLITDAPTERKISGVEIISCGENCSFLQKLLAASKIETEYYLFTLDDYYIKKTIEIQEIYNYLYFLECNQGVYFRFFKRKKSKSRFMKDRYLRILDPNIRYMVNLYTGIWKKELILDILQNAPDNLNIWQFESNIHEFLSEGIKEKLFLGTEKEIYPFVDVIRKGKVLRKANKFLKKNSLTLPTRKVMTLKETLKQNFRVFLARHLPRGLKKTVRNYAKKSGEKFYTDKD